MDQVLSVFQKLDENGDGCISREKLAYVLKAVCPVDWAQEDLNRLLERVNFDEYGSTKYADFVHWLFGNPVSLPLPLKKDVKLRFFDLFEAVWPSGEGWIAQEDELEFAEPACYCGRAYLGKAVGEKVFANTQAAEMNSVDKHLKKLLGEDSPTIEAHSLSTNVAFVNVPGHNQFLQAIHVAFALHYPLVLSPDHIWLCILQGVALHVRENSTELAAFFNISSDSPKKKLRAEVPLDPKKEDWEKFVEDLNKLVREQIGETAHDLLSAEFSTTGQPERIASQICVLDAMQNYFDYEGATACGIPRIALEGVEEDWHSLQLKVEALRELPGLNDWIDVLTSILEQFRQAAAGQFDNSFWASIYKHMSASGGDVVTGWVAALFPYLTPEGKPPEKNPVAWRGGPDSSSPTAYPLGLSVAPWTQVFEGPLEGTPSRDMELLSGFLGVKQDKNTLAVRPLIGWAVRSRHVDGRAVAAAAERADLSTLQDLLEAGASVSSRVYHCDGWRSPLMLAVHSYREYQFNGTFSADTNDFHDRRLQCIQLLSERDTKEGVEEAVKLCILHDRLDFVELMLPTISEQTSPILSNALFSCESVESAERLIRLKANITGKSDNGLTLIQTAMYYRRQELYDFFNFLERCSGATGAEGSGVVDLLAEWPAQKVRLDVQYELIDAAERGDCTRLQELLAQGVSPNTGRICDGYFALSEAVACHQKETVIALLKAGAQLEWTQVERAEEDEEDFKTDSTEQASVVTKSCHVLDFTDFLHKAEAYKMRSVLLLASLVSECNSSLSTLLDTHLDDVTSAMQDALSSPSVEICSPDEADFFCGNLRIPHSLWRRALAGLELDTDVIEE